MNYSVTFTKRNLKRFQKLLDDPQRVPPKPKSVKNNPRSNPPKNKIEKGKKLYEHMNGKAPEKIEKKKIHQNFASISAFKGPVTLP